MLLKTTVNVSPLASVLQKAHTIIGSLMKSLIMYKVNSWGLSHTVANVETAMGTKESVENWCEN